MNNSQKKRIHHKVIHHARRPHGIAIIIAVLFILGWASWTFVIW